MVDKFKFGEKVFILSEGEVHYPQEDGKSTSVILLGGGLIVTPNTRIVRKKDVDHLLESTDKETNKHLDS